jgi:uncharacterized membrane protein (UPF0136 family)
MVAWLPEGKMCSFRSSSQITVIKFAFLLLNLLIAIARRHSPRIFLLFMALKASGILLARSTLRIGS